MSSAAMKPLNFLSSPSYSFNVQSGLSIVSLLKLCVVRIVRSRRAIVHRICNNSQNGHCAQIQRGASSGKSFARCLTRAHDEKHRVGFGCDSHGVGDREYWSRIDNHAIVSRAGRIRSRIAEEPSISAGIASPGPAVGIASCGSSARKT